MATAQRIAVDFGTGVDKVQPTCNRVMRQAEIETLRICMDVGIECARCSQQVSGFWAGKSGNGGSGRLMVDDSYSMRHGLAWMPGTAKGLTALAADMNADPSTLAVARGMAHECRPCAFVPPRALAHSDPSLTAGIFETTAERHPQITTLSQIPPPAADRIEEG